MTDSGAKLRAQRPAMGNLTIAVAAFVLIAVFGILAWLSTTAAPARANQLVGLSLASLSLGFALLVFGFLRGQTAHIRYRGAGLAINVGGAIAAGIVLFGALQFGIRGTSNLVVELYTDAGFTAPWRAPGVTAAPEFGASLESYTVVSKPDDIVVRFHNLPMFERVRFYSRDIGWRVTKLDTSESLCKASGVSLSGWCTSARAVIETNNCLDQWSGSGTLAAKTLGQAVDYFLGEMRKVNYPAKKSSALGQETLRALEADVQPASTFYNRADFCSAINSYKAALEQKLRKKVAIALSCDTIGIAIGDDKMPEPAAGQGWKTPC